MYFLLLIIKKCQLNEPFEILPICFCKGIEYTPHLWSLMLILKD